MGPLARRRRMAGGGHHHRGCAGNRASSGHVRDPQVLSLGLAVVLYAGSRTVAKDMANRDRQLQP